MSVLTTKDKQELIVTCHCGCGEGIHIQINEEDKTEGLFAYITYTSDNFYTGQYGAFGIIKKKLKKIWAIIRNKDYCYSEIYLTEENLKEFKEYLNQF